MTKFVTRAGIKDLLTRWEGRFEALLFVLSALAVALVVSSEFVTSDFTVPWLHVGWAQLQVFLRSTVWLFFVAHFTVYAVFSGRPLYYTRKHLLEFVVCLTWMPYYDGSLLRHLNTILSIETLLLIGAVAHAWRVARWTINRFSTHPLIVVGSAALVMVASASALLTQVEPATFPNLWDAAWYCVNTIFTVGYGDLVPKTGPGRAVGFVLMLGGISLAGVFIATVTNMVKEKLIAKSGPESESNKQLHCDLESTNRLLSDLIVEIRKSNELNARVLSALEKAGATPAELPPGTVPAETPQALDSAAGK